MSTVVQAPKSLSETSEMRSGMHATYGPQDSAIILPSTSRKRKEKCLGGIPCNSCTRRGQASECRVSDIDPVRVVTATRDALPIESPSKRRRIDTCFEPVSTHVNACSISRRLHINSTAGSVVVGDSSTLGLLHFVRSVTLNFVGNCKFVDYDGSYAMLETTHESAGTTHVSSIEEQDLLVLVQYYLDFVHGIFDLFSEDEVLRCFHVWRSDATEARETVSSSSLLLVLAIGAQQRQLANDTEMAEDLFSMAYADISQAMLRPQSLSDIQAHILLVLYLLVCCRRNAAFSHLGMLIRSAQSIGLHERRNDNFDAEIRAWKCLRVLDVSSCASLGRPLLSSESCLQVGQYCLERVMHESGQDVDRAGFMLCAIAERILQTVYVDKQLSLGFAQEVSQELRTWADNLPDTLIDDQHDKDVSDRDQLCRNHMTAAYYWTIILLTRPFLMNAVLGRVGLSEKGLTGKALPDPNTDTASLNSTFVDACINSALRCVDAATVLVRRPRLGKKLFLVVNTTLVSALVLGLAVYGDYDKVLPLEEGLEKATHFLTRMASFDPQAAQYLRFVEQMSDAVKLYLTARAAAEFERRSTQVSQVFGSVCERVSSSGSTGRTNDTTCKTQTMELSRAGERDIPFQQIITRRDEPTKERVSSLVRETDIGFGDAVTMLNFNAIVDESLPWQEDEAGLWLDSMFLGVS